MDIVVTDGILSSNRQWFNLNTRQYR